MVFIYIYDINNLIYMYFVLLKTTANSKAISNSNFNYSCSGAFFNQPEIHEYL